ncbi:MAG: CD1871A family CXXC motif-containing protein [Anaeroplasma sp.]
MIKKYNKLEKALLIIMSVQTILMGILFIIQVSRIYFANPGNDPYTREIVSKYLLQISPIIILWILLIIVCGVYFNIKGSYSYNDKTKITYKSKLSLILKKAPILSKDNNDLLSKKIYVERKNRKLVWIITLIVIAISASMGLLYLINKNHFIASGNNNKQVLNMCFYLLPWILISFGSSIFAIFFSEWSCKKEIELVKGLIKANGKNSIMPEIAYKNKTINIARFIIGFVAIIMIVVGMINGGANDVLQKAVNICTECIGLG